MPFFSIIIPVYNVAPYLRECLDSVLNQTFADWEAICIDDGSTDESGAILDEYAAKDNRFRGFHQENVGVSAARNRALDVVNGEWFLFLDGDDLFRNDSLEIFASFLCVNNIDGILVHPYITHWGGEKILNRKIDTRVLVENATKEDLFLGDYAANGFTSSRVYKYSVFRELRFPKNIKMAEDVCFWFDALCIDAKWMILNADYYLYRQRSNSACGMMNPHFCVDAMQVMLYVLKDIDRMKDVPGTSKIKYLQRFPYTVEHNLNIAISKYKELSDEEWKKIGDLIRQLKKEVGCWPLGIILNIKSFVVINPCWRWLTPFVISFERIYFFVKKGCGFVCRKIGIR